MTTAVLSRRTPLHDLHRALGASFTDFAGWEMPVRYSSETAEHHAVRTTAGLFDLCHMGEIEVTGPDAGAALDRALALATNPAERDLLLRRTQNLRAG